MPVRGESLGRAVTVIGLAMPASLDASRIRREECRLTRLAAVSTACLPLALGTFVQGLAMTHLTARRPNLITGGPFRDDNRGTHQAATAASESWGRLRWAFTRSVGRLPRRELLSLRPPSSP